MLALSFWSLLASIIHTLIVDPSQTTAGAAWVPGNTTLYQAPTFQTFTQGHSHQIWSGQVEQ